MAIKVIVKKVSSGLFNGSVIDFLPRNVVAVLTIGLVKLGQTQGKLEQVEASVAKCRKGG